MENEDKNRVPKLRYPGYTDPWVQRKLGDITKSFSGGTPSVRKKDYYAGKIPFIRSGEISHHVTKLYITNEALKNSSARMVEKGDILYALYGATSGEVAISDIKGAINQAILAIKPIKNDNPYIVYQWLKKQKGRITSTYLQGGQGNLSGSIIKGLFITLPINLNEQEAIGSLFKKIDNLIVLQQCKLDKLKRVKAAYLTEMFPAEGEREPKRRFPGFTGAWVLRKLGEVVTKVNKTSEEDELPRVEYEDIISGQGVLNRNIFEKESKKKGIEFKYGDTLFGKLRPYLKNWLLAEFSGIAVGDWWVLRSDELDSKFLYSLIQTPRYQAFANLSIGTKMPRSDWKVVSKTEFEIPKDREEQQAIGSLFKKLDDLIALQQRKIDTLKLLKKALLQQVFPKNGEDVPKVRFSNFTDKWEQRNLNNIYKSVNEKNDLTLAKNRIISVAKMQWGKTPTESTDKYMRTYNVMRIGDIAFEGNKSKFFKYGRFVENTIGDGLISHVFVVFRPLKEMNLSYWKYFIHDESIMHNVLRMSTTKATMMTNLVKKDFLKQQIFVPNESEQKNIGELLDFLSSISKLSEKKLNSFELLKKTLLQKLFI